MYSALIINKLNNNKTKKINFFLRVLSVIQFLLCIFANSNIDK